MIDLHAHVLPGIDDGPETLAEALALLRVMAEQGIRTVVAAAHALDGRYNVTREVVLDSAGSLQAAVRDAGIDLAVLPSLEHYLDFALIDWARRGRVLGINDSRYLVVELPTGDVPHYTERALYELSIAGYRPIINHPERNQAIQQRPDIMRSLAEKGVMAMVTAGSLTGRFGPTAQRLGEAYVQEEVATLVVSDAHDLLRRAPVLPAGLAEAHRLGKVDQRAEAHVLGATV